jgi:hypothetical protein
MSTLAVNTITNAAGGNTAQINGMTPTADSLQGFRNRIINGNMVIDQRNAGASVTPLDTYTLDRWQGFASVASKYTVQQNAGAVTPPAGFTNYLGVTSSSAYTVGASERFAISQKIEGFNVADLGWGTAGAQPVTLSFWVRSSLTGTFGGVFTNNAYNRSYPYTYSISAANTWEHKTVTIAGDTTGTWLTTSGVGLQIWFGLGAGSSVSGAAGSWSGSTFLSATGAVSVVGTSGATFYITGVQLEAGSVATPFERRPFGTELALCQRYFQRLDMNDGAGLVGMAGSSTFGMVQYPLPVAMRAAPSALGTTGTASDYRFRYGGATFTLASAVPALSSATTSIVRIDTNVASGLTAGNVVVLSAVSSAFLSFSAEL